MIKCKICEKLYANKFLADSCEDNHSLDVLKKIGKSRKQKKIKKWFD